MSTRKSVLVQCLAVLGLISWAYPGLCADLAKTESTQDPNAFYNYVNQGLGDYQEGQFEAAIEAFQAAYRLKPDPKLVFNIARSQERLGRVDAALDSYLDFVGRSGTTAQDRSKALEQIKALKNEKSVRQSILREDPDAGTDPIPPPKVQLAPMGAEASLDAAWLRKPRILEWTLLGVGSAGIVTGGVFGALAAVANKQFNRSNSASIRLAARDRGQRDALISDVSMGAGVLVAGTGLLFWLTQAPAVGAGIGGQF